MMRQESFLKHFDLYPSTRDFLVLNPKSTIALRKKRFYYKGPFTLNPDFNNETITPEVHRPNLSV